MELILSSKEQKKSLDWKKKNSDYFCLSQQWADIHLKTSNIWTTVNSWLSLPGIWTVMEATKQEIPYCAGGLCKSVMEYLKHLISNTVNPFGGKGFWFLKADMKTIHSGIIWKTLDSALWTRHLFF